MKHLFLSVFFLLTLSTVFAQNFLGFKWKIHTDDSIQWKSADFVPHNWKDINIGVSLERQGYSSGGNYSLWNQVIIPSKYKNTNLNLRFKFDTANASVFFNGKFIGSSKKGSSEESLFIPDSLVFWNKPNKILVRILNSFYTGGACGTYIRLLSGEPKDAILDANFINERHLYQGPSVVRFKTSIHLGNKDSFRGVQKAVIINDFHDTVFVKKLNINVSDKKKVTPYAIGKLAPGFYQLQLSFSSPDIEEQKIFGFAVSPEKIKASPINQQQVWNFWERAKKELAAISPDFKLRKIDSLCTDKSNVYIVEMKSLENITVRGWYIVPTKAGVFPSVLHVPGYSVTMRPERFIGTTDMIHLALDVRGHGLSADVIKPGFACPGYIGWRLGEPEKYIYRGTFMDCCRGIDFLLSRPEADSSRIAVEGHSQGGGLSLATAALYSDKIKYCVVGAPFLSDFSDHVKIRTVYMDEMKHYMKNGTISSEQVYQTMNLIDNINLAGFIKCPVLMGVGLFDDDCPPYINFASFNNIKTEKEYFMLPSNGHSLGKEWRAYSESWLRKKFKL
ncbi:acetylxylan esterase [Flavobacterium gawalongense]|uniref:Acetylxylan esterase n=1 Tax=Flavobacterium gawalongense TaxID=2594432 RepID=A0ABY3CNS0_9FLAO|nr:acetylxylan esterase [Flavobacterium gawalongense]TRX03698.1 acetylxylan esterase [Flavobacterium gawalongense]TRX08845.1 acetylxylan esterase [Flavobacterium gawalongense]